MFPMLLSQFSNISLDLSSMRPPVYNLKARHNTRALSPTYIVRRSACSTAVPKSDNFPSVSLVKLNTALSIRGTLSSRRFSVSRVPFTETSMLSISFAIGQRFLQSLYVVLYIAGNSRWSIVFTLSMSLYFLDVSTCWKPTRQASSRQG